jgi:hypothetical protein
LHKKKLKPLQGGAVRLLAVKTVSKAYLAFIVNLSLLFVGCEETDIGMATQAGIDAIRAVTLNDEQVKRLAVDVAKQSAEQ